MFGTSAEGIYTGIKPPTSSHEENSMLGDRFWSTGIIIKKHGLGRWSIWADFYDAGFALQDSVKGRLEMHYDIDDLGRGIDILLLDIQRLGIELREPTVCTSQDGELSDGDHPELREAANKQALRLGWEPAYSEASRETDSSTPPGEMKVPRSHGRLSPLAQP